MHIKVHFFFVLVIRGVFDHINMYMHIQAGAHAEKMGAQDYACINNYVYKLVHPGKKMRA